MSALNETVPMTTACKPRVLVIEDEYFIAMEIVEALEAEGAEVAAVVGTMDEAMLAISRQGDLDGAILDIQLRGDHAWSVALALHERGIAFEFATGYGQEILPAAWRHIPLWQKPFEARALARSLVARMAHRQQQS